MNKYFKSLIVFIVIILSAMIGGAAGLYIGIDIKHRKIPEYNYLFWEEINANNGKTIDFENLGNKNWTQVCFLGPYNNNSSKTLGFPWEITEYTDVLSNDGHNVIIFATDKEVINFNVQIRSHGNFSAMSGKCLKRNNSKLILNNRGSFVHHKA